MERELPLPYFYPDSKPLLSLSPTVATFWTVHQNSGVSDCGLLILYALKG